MTSYLAIAASQNRRFSSIIRRSLLIFGLTLCSLIVTSISYAQFPGGGSHILLQTDTAICDPEIGTVEVNVDAFGALGSVLGSNRHHYNPFNDMPDQGYVRTIFEWMTYFCKESSIGTASGDWLTDRDLSVSPTVSITDGEVNSEFVFQGVRVNLRYWLDCTTVKYCYTFTNESNDVIPTIAITPYMDGDLYFGTGGLSNDYGAASLGRPKTLWEFDEGDNPQEPTTYVGITTLGDDDFLNSWEVGAYSEQKRRVSSVSNGCTALRDDINRSGMNIDVNNDLITDRGYDVTLAIRYDVGPLAPGQQSAELCYGLQWGVGLPCSDEDLDTVCLPDDNCPLLPNPDQEDEDGDGIGDICDNCPKVENLDQSDRDLDGFGDACDRVFCTPDGGPEVCDGVDNDCDGLIDILPDGSPVVVPGDCSTGLSGGCGLGTWACIAGRTRCVPSEQSNPEICDLNDNDCDGIVDEDVRNRCGTCGAIPAESCNNIDDDCDGMIDEGSAGCGQGQGCYEGLCLNECGDEGCPANDSFCADDVCVPWCVLNSCEVEGEECTSQGCLNPCANISCNEGELCTNGECGPAEDCTFTGCAEGERCSPGGCEPNPCVGVNCGEGSFCRDGECVFSCAEVSCPAAHACFDGLCQPTGCLPLGCPYEGEVCLDRICQPDPCDLVSCDTAEVCYLGECITDPCLGVECPQYQRCEVVVDTAQCVADWPVLEEMEPTQDMMMPVIEVDMESPEGDMGAPNNMLGDIDLPDSENNVENNEDKGCDAQGRKGPATGIFFLLMLLSLRALSSRWRHTV